jgi:hypothetical protein
MMRFSSRAALSIIVLTVVTLSTESARGQFVNNAGGVTGTSINVRTLVTGTVLSVTPAASPDGRYVGMSINPQFSTLDGVDTFVLSNPTSAGATGGVAGNGTMQAVAIKRIPFRPAVYGKVTCVDNDKPLLAASVKAQTWSGISLKEAVNKLADASHENMVLGNRGLEQAGVDVNTRHDFSIPAGSVKDALLAILRVGVPNTNMVISSEDRVVQVMTQAQADQVLITRTYYLQDLLANMPRFVAADTNLYDVGGGTTGGHVTGVEAAAADTGRAFDVSKPLEKRDSPVKAAKKTGNSTTILDVITDTVRPEVWVNHGGKSEIALVGDRVTVKAPASVHAILDGPKVYNPNKINSYVDYGR